jgi:hypothetical protein
MNSPEDVLERYKATVRSAIVDLADRKLRSLEEEHARSGVAVSRAQLVDLMEAELPAALSQAQAGTLWSDEHKALQLEIAFEVIQDLRRRSRN